VPYAAGGAADTVARVVGQRMSQELGQPVVIENRAGADGNIGAELVARSPADGYTILMGDVGNLTMGPAVRKSVPYDAVRDFAPISQIVSAPNILAVHPSVPATTFKDFIAYAKANPNALTYASSGTGGSAHLAGELLKSATGIEMVHVPYKGASAAIADVLRGDVKSMFGLSVVLPHVKDGKLRPLAATGLRRMKSLPDLPTIAESGFPGFEATAWYGLLAPAGTPEPAVVKLHEAAATALKAPEVRDKLESSGYDIVGSTPSQFSAYIKSEQKKWSDIVKAAGIKVE
jgi:tripartite-type tricarboxylate transporter receptor subunit TctC